MSNARDARAVKDTMAEDLIFEAEEGFLFDIQYAIEALMKDKAVSRKKLAEMLGVSASRVTEMLSDEGANLTLRTVGRIFAHLGEIPEITCPGLAEAYAKARSKALASLKPAVAEPTASAATDDIFDFVQQSRQHTNWTLKWAVNDDSEVDMDLRKFA